MKKKILLSEIDYIYIVAGRDWPFFDSEYGHIEPMPGQLAQFQHHVTLFWDISSYIQNDYFNLKNGKKQ